MKTAAFAIALLMSSTAFAQTTTTTDDMATDHSTMQHSNMAPASGQIVQPANSNPEEDARGITVISAPAFVPTGWNATSGTAVGGPLVDPATGETSGGADMNYPACTAAITDNCVQTYEKGRRS